MTATTTPLEQHTPRLPRLRRATNRLRAAVALAVVWVEAWPPLMATAAVAAHHRHPTHPAVVGCAALTLAILWRAWSTGALTQNVCDTINVLVRLSWRNRAVTTWQMPHLIEVNTHRPLSIPRAVDQWRVEGWRAVPADHMEIVIRPNDSQGSEAFIERVGDWCARRFGFEHVEILPWHRSTNCLSITMTGRSIPDHVGS